VPGPLVRTGRTAKPPRCALHSHSLSFTFSLAHIAEQSKPPSSSSPPTQHHHLIHLAHSSAIISSTFPSRHCHRSSPGTATFHVFVAAMVTERHQALSSPRANLIHRSSYLFLPSSIITLGHRCSRHHLFNHYHRYHAKTRDAIVRVCHGCKHALAAANFIGHP